MKKLFLFISFIFCLFITSSVFAASLAKAVREGNRLYQQEKYDEAIEKYNEAKTESPDSDIINFNLGAALYKKGRYQEAIDSFTKALNTEDKELEAKVIYNIANSKYKLGNLQANKDLNSAIVLYRESLDYYKWAIELNENDKDAKYNHEFVEKKLNVFLEKLKNQPSQQQQKQNQHKEDKQQQQSQAKSDKVKENQHASDSKQAKSIDEKDKMPEKEGTEGEQAPQATEEELKEMTPEEAIMLLEAYGHEEAGRDFKRQKMGYYTEVLKDW